MSPITRSEKELAELAVERALECALDSVSCKSHVPGVEIDHAKRLGFAASEVFVEQIGIGKVPLAFDPAVVELANEWVFHSGMFGIVAEIHNGVYDNGHCAKLALAIVEMDRKLKQNARPR